MLRPPHVCVQVRKAGAKNVLKALGVFFLD